LLGLKPSGPQALRPHLLRRHAVKGVKQAREREPPAAALARGALLGEGRVHVLKQQQGSGGWGRDVRGGPGRGTREVMRLAW
jgi:hypothetical protein